MEQVLTKSTHLMGSEGKEYDLEEDSRALALEGKERIAYQRQQLNMRLGLDFAAQIGLDMTGMLTNEDLIEENIVDVSQNNELNKVSSFKNSSLPILLSFYSVVKLKG